MGWLYTNFPREGPKRYFDAKLTHSDEKRTQRVLRSAFFGRFEYYAALERVYHEDVYIHGAYVDGAPVGPSRLVARKGDREVVAVVIMVRYVMNGSHPFGYKDMTEYAGPVIRNCPKTILDLLTPIPPPEDPTAETSQNWALQWRKDCAENSQRRHEARSRAAKRAAQTRAQHKAWREAQRVPASG